MTPTSALSNFNITNVRFQYGTELSEPSFDGSLQVAAVPEPSTWIAAAIAGVVTLGLRRMRRKADVP